MSVGNSIITLVNTFIIYLFTFLYTQCKFETVEDRFHKHKKNGKNWNKVKIEFKKNDEMNKVKANLLDIINNQDILQKYDVTAESIINNTNNKIAVSFKDNCIFIHFNHYYISGPNMFVFLNRIFNSSPPTFLQTNPFWGIVYMPFYLYESFFLQKRQYVKFKEIKEDFMVEQNITAPNKRCCSYLHILEKVYLSLQLDRPMVVALSIGFDDLPYVRNNVGLIILHYEIFDTIETFSKKMKKAYYQAYCSNFLLNCPLPDIGSIEIRDYVDCIVSSMYIKSDYDFTVAWNCNKPPIEQMYVGSVSVIRSDGTLDVNMCFNSCSSQYQNPYKYISNFFEE